MKPRNIITALMLAGGLVAANSAMADAVIFSNDGSVALGVHDEGHLNITDPTGTTSTANAGFVGLAYLFPSGAYEDATAPGCLCEGWGVSATSGGSDYSGYANVSVDGVNNLTLDSFATDAAAGTGTMATSSVHLTSLTGLSVTQAYSAADSAGNVLFKDVVTITNTTGDTLTDLRYVRVMDWDIPPNEFSEYVTIAGTATTTFLEMSHDDGFTTANPLGGDIDSQIAVCGGQLVDFTDCNGTDHGAYFRFNFGDLAEGESYEFTIFYGAAGTETAALAAIAAESIELFSLGQSNVDPSGGTPATFIFGFAGVGGVPVLEAPEPGMILLMGIGFAGIGAARMRRRRAR